MSENVALIHVLIERILGEKKILDACVFPTRILKNTTPSKNKTDWNIEFEF